MNIIKRLLNEVRYILYPPRGCPKIPKHGYVTAVFHAHEWAWLHKKYCFDEFKTLLKNYHNDVVSFDEYRM